MHQLLDIAATLPHPNEPLMRNGTWLRRLLVQPDVNGWIRRSARTTACFLDDSSSMYNPPTRRISHEKVHERVHQSRGIRLFGEAFRSAQSGVGRTGRWNECTVSNHGMETRWAKNLSHDARIDEQSKTYKTTWMQNRYPVEVTWTERQHVQFP